jgi:heptosyltransferase-2
MSFLHTLDFFWKLKNLKFDVVFDLIGTPKSAFDTYLIAGKIHISAKKRFFGFLNGGYVKASDNPYHYNVFFKLLFLEKLFVLLGKDALRKSSLLNYSQKLEIYLIEKEKTFVDQFCKKHDFQNIPTVALNAVSRRDYKIWDPKNFAEIVVYLLKKNKRVFFLYGPGELSLVHEVVKHLPSEFQTHENLLIDYEFLNLRQLYGVLANCELYIGNDAGPKHLACAAGIGTVTIFQHVDAKDWTPYADSKHKAFESSVHTTRDILAYLEEKL